MVCGNRGCVALLAVLLLAVLAIPSQARDYQAANYQDRLFTNRELDNLLAPVALYPDALLSQVLMAATYPLEVEEAARWVRAHPGIDPNEAARRAERMGWEPSIQSLVVFPDVLERMYRNPEWTHAVGDAWLLQEADVVDSIQRLRDEAWAAGHLHSRDHVHAYRDREVIIIEPPRREVVYVPYYDPVVVYGSWWRPMYSSFHWWAPVGFHSYHVIYWGRPVPVRPVFYFSTFHWHQRHIVLVDRRYHRPHYSRGVSHAHLKDARRWRHDPVHRRGVDYRHPVTRETYRGDGGHRQHQRGRDATQPGQWRDEGHRRDYRDPARAERTSGDRPSRDGNEWRDRRDDRQTGSRGRSVGGGSERNHRDGASRGRTVEGLSGNNFRDSGSRGQTLNQAPRGSYQAQRQPPRPPAADRRDQSSTAFQNQRRQRDATTGSAFRQATPGTQSDARRPGGREPRAATTERPGLGAAERNRPTAAPQSRGGGSVGATPSWQREANSSRVDRSRAQNNRASTARQGRGEAVSRSAAPAIQSSTGRDSGARSFSGNTSGNTSSFSGNTSSFSGNNRRDTGASNARGFNRGQESRPSGTRQGASGSSWNRPAAQGAGGRRDSSRGGSPGSGGNRQR